MKSSKNGVLSIATACVLVVLLAGCPPPANVKDSAYTDEIKEIETRDPDPAGRPKTLFSDAGQVTSFAVTVEAVYFTTARAVSRYDKKDGKITVLVEDEHSPMCLDTDESTLFWCEYAAGTIKKLDLGEQGTVEVLAKSIQRPRGLVVDGDMVYVAENIDEGTIVGLPLRGGDRVTLATGQKLPVVGATDRDRVYWTNQVRGKSAIMAVAKFGGAPVVLAKDQQIPTAMAVDGDNAYWTSPESILSVPLAGGKVAPLAEGQASPAGLVATLDGLFWTNGDDGSVWRLKKGADMPEAISRVEGLPALIKAHGDSLYWTDESPPGLRSIKVP
jgi:hypothetical protein